MTERRVARAVAAAERSTYSVANIAAAAARSVYRRKGSLGGELPAATVLAWLDDGSGSWDEVAGFVVRLDRRERAGESYPLDYQAALYWPEVEPERLVSMRPWRGEEHEDG